MFKLYVTELVESIGEYTEQDIQIYSAIGKYHILFNLCT